MKTTAETKLRDERLLCGSTAVSKTELERVLEQARAAGWAEFHGIWFEARVPAGIVVKLLEEYEKVCLEVSVDKLKDKLRMTAAFLDTKTLYFIECAACGEFWFDKEPPECDGVCPQCGAKLEAAP